MNISKVRNYKKNEILDKIIEIVVPKKRSSILLRFLRYKKNELPKKYITSINPVQTLELQPYLSNNISGYKDIQVDISGRQSCGGYGCAYFNIKSKNRKKIDNIIFKTITDKKEEFKSLIFHYLIYKYYENNNNVKYLCELYEFGELNNLIIINKKKIKYYAIMKNCGMKLSEYFEIIIERNKKISVKDRLKNLLTIFKECCKTVKIIHDLGYLHLDIKPENFLINDNNQVKIIDFGFIKKNGYKTDYLFGTGKYIANDWLINLSLEKKTTLEYHHDIFSLGCMFIELLYGYVFGEKIKMACPIKRQILEYNNIYAIRKDYESSSQHYEIEIKLKNKLQVSSFFTKNLQKETSDLQNNILELQNNILNLIISMVNSKPSQRYQNIDDVIAQINFIEEIMNSNSKNSSNL